MAEPRIIRILITGSRDWSDLEKFNDTMTLVQRQHPDTSRWVIVHGDCPDGADAIADAWAKVRGIRREPHPANWGKHGRKAGFRRNEEMVAAGADVCLAFLCPCIKRNCNTKGIHGSHGTTDCSVRARKGDIATWTIRDKFPS